MDQQIRMHRRRGPNFTYVSGCVKYMIFVLNFIFWVSKMLLFAPENINISIKSVNSQNFTRNNTSKGSSLMLLKLV